MNINKEQQTEVEEFKELQKTSHYRQTDHNNRMGRLSARKQNIILVMLAVMLTYFATNFYTIHYGSLLAGGDSISSLRKSIEELKKSDRKIIWFDRKRIHSDAGFAKIDEKYPAQYEVWQGDKLIERWHWQVSHDPRTAQFGKYITRCVAKYDHNDKYSGMDQYLMSDFPKGHAGIDSERLTIPNSIKMTVNNELGNIIFENDTIKATWIGGNFAFAEQLNGGYPFDKGNIHPSEIINNEEDVKYLKHLSSMFQFLQKDVIEPYEARTEFASLLKDAPKKTRDEWENFVEQVRKSPNKIQAHMNGLWERNQKDSVSK